MTTMKANTTFTGPKGQIKEGQVVDISPRIAESWERQGIASPVGGKKKSVKDKALHTENTPSLKSEGNDDPGKSDQGKEPDTSGGTPPTAE